MFTSLSTSFYSVWNFCMIDAETSLVVSLSSSLFFWVFHAKSSFAKCAKPAASFIFIIFLIYFFYLNLVRLSLGLVLDYYIAECRRQLPTIQHADGMQSVWGGFVLAKTEYQSQNQRNFFFHPVQTVLEQVCEANSLEFVLWLCIPWLANLDEVKFCRICFQSIFK